MVAEILTMRERAATSAMLTIAKACAGFSSLFIDRYGDVTPHALSIVLTTPLLNRFVPYMLQAQITAPRITQIVATSKKVLFPNGYPSPPPIDPTPEEQVIMREQLETRLLDLLPRMSINYLLVCLLNVFDFQRWLRKRFLVLQLRHADGR